MKINLHIERLVVDGISLSPTERLLLKAMMAADLSHRLANGGVSDALQSAGALSSVRTTGIQLISGETPARLAEQIAGAVYEGIGK